MYRKWRLECSKCGYCYAVELVKPYEIETCPVCAYQAPFDDFVEYEVDKDTLEHIDN